VTISFYQRGYMKAFTYDANPAHIVFGEGSSRNVANEVRRLGGGRALVLSTPTQVENARRMNDQLDEVGGGVFSGAAMHTPMDVTQQAIVAYERVGADCLVALGGGSTIGLGKAIAYRVNAPQIAVATTYAGSEVTPILGETDNGVKTTVKDSSILPDTVIYDPELTVNLPVSTSVTSGLNAMAHALEGLYAKDRNPITALMALEGIRTLKEALPVIVERPDDVEARSDALYGAWLCGTVLGSVGMALHHKLCHTLGGSFGLPHAETHSIMLPHTMAYNARAAADLLAPAARLFGDDLGGGLYDFAKSIGAPLSLKGLGLAEADLDRAAELAMKNPYWNPQAMECNGIRGLLQHAWGGVRPE
jgi:maleylacetate reductase